MKTDRTALTETFNVLNPYLTQQKIEQFQKNDFDSKRRALEKKYLEQQNPNPPNKKYL